MFALHVPSGTHHCRRQHHVRSTHHLPKRANIIEKGLAKASPFSGGEGEIRSAHPPCADTHSSAINTPPDCFSPALLRFAPSSSNLLFYHKKASLSGDFLIGAEREIRTLGTVSAFTRFPVVRLRPAQPSLLIFSIYITPASPVIPRNSPSQYISLCISLVEIT